MFKVLRYTFFRYKVWYEAAEMAVQREYMSDVTRGDFCQSGASSLSYAGLLKLVRKLRTVS